MNPLIGSLLLQGLGGGIGALFGGRRQRAERKRRRELARLASPEYRRMLQTQEYNQALASPAFGETRRQAFNAGSTLSNRLQGSLAARGLSGSGVGALAGPLSQTATSGLLSRARGDLFEQSGQRAREQQMIQLGAFQGMGEEPDYVGEALGGSLSDIASTLLGYGGGGNRPEADDVNPMPKAPRRRRAMRGPVYD